ncbi:hypothetical protein GM51_2935 [freshwater metagenome]|uniref:NADP-dependent oxidoreductase domain-containing protein n=1 Tax=freshwater metagenome TaxID=449393 RepID=A0A094QG25_9ZZZZ
MGEPSEYSRKLVIGTASWGQQYGLFNGSAANTFEARNILSLALNSGITSLDTAPSYGKSEEIIGECGIPNLRVFTKLESSWLDKSLESVYEDIRSSLGRLGVSCLTGLTFHSAGSFFRDSRRALSLVSGAIHEGLVSEWGVSVYKTEEVEMLLEITNPNYIQAPVSIVDRRFIGDDISKKMLENSVKLQARSVFLQGLILNGVGRLPDHFSRFRGLFGTYERIAESAGLSMLSLALMPILSQKSVQSVVVGIHDFSQLEELIDVMSFVGTGVDLESIPHCSDEDLVDPRRWPDFR